MLVVCEVNLMSCKLLYTKKTTTSLVSLKLGSIQRTETTWPSTHFPAITLIVARDLTVQGAV